MSNSTNRFLYACIAATLLLSCEGETERGMKEMSVSISSDVTRSVLSGKQVLWLQGDAISLFDGIGNNKFTTDGSGTSAVFKGTAYSSGQYYALYPYSSSSSLVRDGVRTVLPEHQTAMNGTFADEVNLSVSVVTQKDGALSAVMKNVGSYFKFSIKDSDAGICRVSVSASGGEDLSGNVTIGFDAEGYPMILVVDGQPDVSLVPESGTFASGEYFAVLVPTPLSEGLSLEICYADGTSSYYRFPTLHELRRNTVYNVSKSVEGVRITVEHEGLGEEVHVCAASHEGLHQEMNFWNTWTDAESVKAAFIKARDNGKTYFSNFKYYNYLVGGHLEQSMAQKYGYPLIYSIDFYEGSGTYFPKEHRDEVRENILNIVKNAWRKNRAIPSFSWHLESPYAVYDDFYVNYGESMGCRYIWRTDAAWSDVYPDKHRYVVRDILANKQIDSLGIKGLGDWFDERCREVAGIINEFKDDSGQPIPILFRLWHELEHRWAWWQLYYYQEHNSNCTIADYKELYRLTVTKIREYCPDAEILFGFCTDRSFETEERYMTAYPGDEYVDIMGYDDYDIAELDSYAGVENPYQANVDAMLLRARIVSEAARKHGKIAAMFETNNTQESEWSKFYTDYIQVMLKDPQTSLSMFQIWSACANKPEKAEALKGFLEEENVIFDD